MKIIISSAFFFIILLFSACQKLENTIDLGLEPSENKLVVECYLEPGQPYRLLLTETKDYFDSLTSCALIRNAIVVIKHNGHHDTLSEATYSGNDCADIFPFWNGTFTRFFNYGSGTICPHDLDHDFSLEVWDTTNDRHVTAKTRLLPTVRVTEFNVTFDEDTIASCYLGCKDAPHEENYYRFTLHKTSLTKPSVGTIFPNVERNPYFDELLNDRFISAGGTILHASDYEFFRTDTLIGSIYHIEKAYYDYLETSRSAENANLSPFVQPSAIVSNIDEGHGIFTVLSYQRDSLYIPW